MGNTGFTSIRNSFVYENLVTHVQRIQEQLKIGTKLLDDQWENNKEAKNRLKYRSFIFIDPFGNQTKFKCMDHELLRDVFEKYKQKYVPQYLQQSIRIGYAHGNSIFVLNDEQFMSTVSIYPENTEFSTYVQLIVWIGTFKSLRMKKVSLHVLPISNIEKITRELKRSLKYTDLELRSIQLDNLTQLDQIKWANSTILKSKDTIISHKLYETNRMVMVKITQPNIDVEILTKIFEINVRIVDRMTIVLKVTSDMMIESVKTLIEYHTGVQSDQQCLSFAGKQLEDEQTLEDIKLQPESTLDLTLKLQDRIYYFTGDRQRFSTLPYNTTIAIRNILKFRLKSFKNPSKLQQYVLHGEILLQNLFHHIQEIQTPAHFVDLKNILSEFF